MDNKISPEAQVAELELDAVIGFNGPVLLKLFLVNKLPTQAKQ
ncbi:CFAP52 isoform 6 [Pan troglodytes]|uniref:Cilia and flagella associated protein 52 n=3 Tax=Hominidae TaxID=9604 RepID=A0A096LNH3_HUMAN|nr:CFAP52 isoform 6 [Pan troglodytes]PNJ31739.1 CFAP52 isoform 3 [Pongo abelii]